MSDVFKNLSKKEKQDNRAGKAEILELLKNTLIMLLIAVVAGGILGLVYEVTKEPIAQMEAKEKQTANRKVFMMADHFGDNILSEDMITQELKETYSGVDITEVLEVFDASNNVMGYVLEVVSHEGYGGDIVFRIGIDNEGVVNAISITSISETAGLGMRAEEVLVPQFRNRSESFFEVSKTGSTADNSIDAISSATITSKAVTGGVNAALLMYRESLMGGADDES